ncbi:MAG: hypothetical protein E7260_08555 [Lachnospiraceae bacterium]|nr:hypothetical protein [Lachnospiraceae bacterium]
MKIRKKKGSVTVEAALVCPFVCLILCAMLVITVSFYEKVETFGTESIQRLKESDRTVTVLRMERILMEISK